MGGKHCGGYSKSKHKQKVHCVKKKGVTQINNMQWKISRKGRVFPSFFSQGLPLHKWVRRGTFFLKRRSTQNFPQKSVLPQVFFVPHSASNRFICLQKCANSSFFPTKCADSNHLSQRALTRSFSKKCADSIFLVSKTALTRVGLSPKSVPSHLHFPKNAQTWKLFQTSALKCKPTYKWRTFSEKKN